MRFRSRNQGKARPSKGAWGVWVWREFYRSHRQKYKKSMFYKDENEGETKRISKRDKGGRYEII